MRSKATNMFKKACPEWLETIEMMCNQILGKYITKEYHMLTSHHSLQLTRKIRPNKVFEVFDFPYLDYHNLSKDVEARVKKREVIIIEREATRQVKKKKLILKRVKCVAKETILKRDDKASEEKTKEVATMNGLEE